MPRLLASLLLLSACAFAQYTNIHEIAEYGGPQEFANRRDALCKAVGNKGTILLFARVVLPESSHYREDNDFFYYTGLREPGAAILIDAAHCNSSIVFQPNYSPRQIQVLGPTILSRSKEERAALGYNSALPITELDGFLSRLSGTKDWQLWVRMGFPDSATGARQETGFDNQRHYDNPYGDDDPSNIVAVNKLRARYPMAQMHDLTPLIDAQRNIKTANEQTVLRKVGKLGAAGLKRAISIAKPGMMQYEVEAEASYIFAKNGAEGWAYPAIVGSGKNANTWHYFSNREKINPGDVVVFDFSPDYHHMTMDITRTFAIDGKFTPEQAKWYQATLEAQKAIIEMCKPGNTYEQAAAAGLKVYEKYGVADQYSRRPDGTPTISGHWVGLATHDVGGYLSGPVKPGQVFTVEPIIEFPDKQWHFRVEDTILITENGNENLSADVPKEMADVEKLVGSAATK
jgi:Xaa-Pro aminopeptidase